MSKGGPCRPLYLLAGGLVSYQQSHGFLKMIVCGGTFSRSHASESSTLHKHIHPDPLFRSDEKACQPLPQYFCGTRIAMWARVYSVSHSTNRRIAVVRNVISVLLAAFLSQATSFAQSPVIETSAAKPVQQSQSIADTYDSMLPTSRDVKLPAGTPIDIESAYTVSSLDLKPNEYLSFRVLIPVKIDGVTVIEKGALVTARVVEARRGKHWGKAGRLSWIMIDVVAVDGTRPSVQAQRDIPDGSNGIKGTSHGAEVATKTIVMGVLLAPFFPIAPLALMSGFKRGENAVLPEGKRFVVFVQSDAVVKVSADR
jgi:hypothetical protein